MGTRVIDKKNRIAVTRMAIERGERKRGANTFANTKDRRTDKQIDRQTDRRDRAHTFARASNTHTHTRALARTQIDECTHTRKGKMH